MKLYKLVDSFEDNRGVIKDLLTKEPIDAVTHITSKKGTVRANHYHKETYQWTYVLSGKINYYYKKNNEPKENIVLTKGQLILSEPNEAHTLLAMEDSELIVFTRGPRGGKEYESDTYKLTEPLV